MIYKCDCGGAIQEVAFNCDIDDMDLYDSICPKCGRHYVLAFDNKFDLFKILLEYPITVFVDEIEGYQYGKCVDGAIDEEKNVQRVIIECLSGTRINRWVKFVNDTAKINPDGFGYIVRL